ncbi:hypothetical protein BH24GEM3_BH24GEM3_03920 [soil metagenome]
MPSSTPHEAEWQTRKRRIDPGLDASGWIAPADDSHPQREAHRREEYETTFGPADYALFADGRPLGIVSWSPTLSPSWRARSRS